MVVVVVVALLLLPLLLLLACALDTRVFLHLLLHTRPLFLQLLLHTQPPPHLLVAAPQMHDLSRLF